MTLRIDYARRRSALLPLLAATLLWPALGHAQADCGSAGNPSRLTARSDNDVYGRAKQDQGYSAGFAFAYVSPTFEGGAAAPCGPRLVRWLDGHLGWLQIDGAQQRNLVLTGTQGIYTPTDGTRADLILDDRPYAGVMMFGVGANSRRGAHLATTQLRLGMVGPSAAGEWAQDNVHRIFGRARFKGWDNQLRDEVLVQVQHERLWRFKRDERSNGWGWDLTGHAGGSLGNRTTFANTGAEVRWGKFLPDDFGTDPQRPAGENSAPSARAFDGSRWAWHLFSSIDARWVLQDITLDGNTWKDSHSVDARDAVADFSVGIAVTRGRWKLAGAHVTRTREFEGQADTPVFGSVSLSVAL
ncbi:MAG: lipid A deacylase LpxR family protein [Arenimonas sp.]|nr:lipid A deacylase LpxR family protein [Arenimonas sp.]